MLMFLDLVATAGSVLKRFRVEIPSPCDVMDSYLDGQLLQALKKAYRPTIYAVLIPSLFHSLMLMSTAAPGQTEWQVDANWKLGSSCDSVCPGLACSCVDFNLVTRTFSLAWEKVLGTRLALTCDDLAHFSGNHFFFHRFATQLKSTQVECRPLNYY